MKKILLTLCTLAALSGSAFAGSIQDIEDEISTIDLDQSKDDIRADLDNIIQELEDLKEDKSQSWIQTYRSTPVTRVQTLSDYTNAGKAPKAKLVKNPWPQSENLKHEND